MPQSTIIFHEGEIKNRNGKYIQRPNLIQFLRIGRYDDNNNNNNINIASYQRGFFCPTHLVFLDRCPVKDLSLTSNIIPSNEFIFL